MGGIDRKFKLNMILTEVLKKNGAFLSEGIKESGFKKFKQLFNMFIDKF